MKVEIEKCKIENDTIYLCAKFIGTFEDLAKDLKNNRYEKDSLYSHVRDIVAHAIANEYLAKNRMDLINAISKEEVLNGIQLKIIENFSISKRD